MTPAPRATVDEVLNHPTYPTTIWQLTPSQQGKLDVAAGRGGPFKLSWEVHGAGKTKLVFIMGLGAIKSAWQRQTLHFGHELGDKYSVLVFDNRGMGESDKPAMRYSTSEMAKDVKEITDHLGWTADRELNVCGVSMGGMIAQEFAYHFPTSIASLTLTSTAARITNTTGFIENLRSRINLVIPKSLSQNVTTAAYNLFPDSWLDSPDNSPLPTTSTPNVVIPPGGYKHFSLNFERFAAQEISKRLNPEYFTRTGFLMQCIAAGWHYKSPEQLAEMAEKVERERIMVLHGTEDRMISFPHYKVLVDAIKPGKEVVREGQGHVLMMEWTDGYNKLVAEHIAEAEKLAK